MATPLFLTNAWNSFSSASVVSYPALHFLLLVPVHALGLNGARILYVLCYALIGALLFLRAPKPLRAVILLPLWVNPEYLGFPVSFVTDAVWALLLLGSVLTWRHSTWRAVFYGLACAYKQIPWLLAPFIFVRLLIDDEDSDGGPPLQRASFSGLAVRVLRGERPSWSPISPDRAAFHAHGHLVIRHGPHQHHVFGLVELRPSYAASLAVMLSLTLLRAGGRWRHIGLYPGLALWFSYRSLQSYFVYWVPLLTAVVVEEARERTSGLVRRERDVEQRSQEDAWSRLNGLALRAAAWLQARKHWTPGVAGAALSMILARRSIGRQLAVAAGC
jgi:hypothetical protein